MVNKTTIESEGFWISLNPHINWGVIIGLLIANISAIKLRRLIVKYLDEKSEGFKSLMDEAHTFFFDFLVARHLAYSLQLIIKSLFIFGNSKHVIGFILSATINTLACTTFVSLMVNTVTQFLLVMQPTWVSDLKYSDRTVFIIIKTVTTCIMLITTVIFQFLGFEPITYLRWMDLEYSHFNAMAVFRKTLGLVSFLTFVILRIILKFKFNRDGHLQSKQLISNKALMIFILLFATLVVIKLTGLSFQSLNLAQDIQYASSPSVAFLIVIFTHKDLRSRLKRKMIAKLKSYCSKLKCRSRDEVEPTSVEEVDTSNNNAIELNVFPNPPRNVRVAWD